MKLLIPDALWEEIAPLLPPVTRRRFRFPGRKPLERRKVISGIIFVLKTGIAWDDMPAELGLGCGRTCRDYLKKLQDLGVWQRLHTRLLTLLNHAGRIAWTLGVIDSASCRAPLGGAETGPNPTDRRKLGSKHHIMTDGNGIPLATNLSGANTPDINRLLPVVTGVPSVGGKPGPPRQRVDKVMGDRAYDSEPHRRILRWLRIRPLFGKRRTPHGSGMGVLRWVVERTLSWLHHFGRLRRRTDRLPSLQIAFVSLACVLICWRFLQQ